MSKHKVKWIDNRPNSNMLCDAAWDRGVWELTGHVGLGGYWT